MDYDSAADMVVEEVVTGSELYDLFKNQVQVQENEAVIQQACLLLSEAGITQAWQLEEVPMEVLKELMPPGQHLKPYLVTAHVQRTLKTVACAEGRERQGGRGPDGIHGGE